MERRRKFLTIVPDTNKMKIQLKYLVLIVLTQLACISILVIGFNSILHVLLKAAQLGHYAEMQLGKIFVWMNCLFGVVTVFSIIIGGILSLKLSHKFVGPIFRMENILKDALKKDKMPELNIRKDDELHELIALLNEFLKKRGLI